MPNPEHFSTNANLKQPLNLIQPLATPNSEQFERDATREADHVYCA